MKKTEALNLMAGLKAAFPRFAFSNETIEIYVQRLQPLQYELAMVAIRDCIDTCVHPPAIAEIRRACAERALRLPTASQAWADVHDRIAQGAALCSVENGLAREVAKGMGWWNLKTGSNPETTRAHFLKAYNEQRERALMAVQTDNPHLLPKGVEVRLLNA